MVVTAEQFKHDVRSLAEEVGVDVKEIHLRSMKRKWASCSSRGRLTFDKSLLQQPAEVQVRTILHELLHLRYPHHGRMFNLMLKQYLGRMNRGRQK